MVVNLVNISRGGVCFTSAEPFYRGTVVSIATSYREGTHNLFIPAQIVRVQREPSPELVGEFALRFLDAEGQRSKRRL